MEEYLASGAILEVQGTISGAGKLTKAGYDTVILSGANTYTGGTHIEGGKLMIGRDDALPTTTTLTTTGNGILDLNGQNQTVGTLTNPGTPAAVVNSTSGFITNSATAYNTLTVGNAVTTDFTYAGVIQHNVALTKTGTAALTFTNANTYTGKTTVAEGILKLGATGSIHDSAWLSVSPGAVFDSSAIVGGLTYDGTITGGDPEPAGTFYNSVVTGARLATGPTGTLTVGDHVGAVNRVGTISPGGSSLPGDITTAGNQIGHLFVEGNLTLTGPVATTSVATNRLTLQINGPTTTLTALGYTFGDPTSFIAGLPTGTPTQQDMLNGFQGDLQNHDYLRITNDLTLNTGGRIAVTNYSGFSPAFGDLFNLLDWGNLNLNTWNPASDLNLPSLGVGQSWDTSLFTTHGVIVVVPEPSRALLLLLGLFGLIARRRRNRAVAA
jgi:autotransporter-associated beta strand protein